MTIQVHTYTRIARTSMLCSCMFIVYCLYSSISLAIDGPQRAVGYQPRMCSTSSSAFCLRGVSCASNLEERPRIVTTINNGVMFEQHKLDERRALIDDLLCYECPVFHTAAWVNGILGKLNQERSQSEIFLFRFVSSVTKNENPSEHHI